MWRLIAFLTSSSMSFPAKTLLLIKRVPMMSRMWCNFVFMAIEFVVRRIDNHEVTSGLAFLYRLSMNGFYCFVKGKCALKNERNNQRERNQTNSKRCLNMSNLRVETRSS